MTVSCVRRRHSGLFAHAEAGYRGWRIVQCGIHHDDNAAAASSERVERNT